MVHALPVWLYSVSYESYIQFMSCFLLPYTGYLHLYPPGLPKYSYRQVSNTIRALVGIQIVDYSEEVIAASHVGAAPTTSSFST